MLYLGVNYGLSINICIAIYLIGQTWASERLESVEKPVKLKKRSTHLKFPAVVVNCTDCMSGYILWSNTNNLGTVSALSLCILITIKRDWFSMHVVYVVLPFRSYYSLPSDLFYQKGKIKKFRPFSVFFTHLLLQRKASHWVSIVKKLKTIMLINSGQIYNSLRMT